MQLFYNLVFVPTGRILPQSLTGVSIAKQINDFGMVLGCVQHYSASPFVCQQDSDVPVSFEWCQGLLFLSCAFALARAADTLKLSRRCSASVSASLLFLMADSLAVMRSAAGICSGATAKCSPLARMSFSDWVTRAFLDRWMPYIIWFKDSSI